jgi:hypothetical protein
MPTASWRQPFGSRVLSSSPGFNTVLGSSSDDERRAAPEKLRDMDADDTRSTATW